MEITVLGHDENVDRIAIKGAITQKKVSQTDKVLPDLLGPGVYKRNVLLSLEGTNFIDSSGVNWLLSCHKKFAAEGGRMVLHSVPELAGKVLRILRLETVFELAADESEAVRVIGAPRAPRESPAANEEE